jgi:hypothetical protein
LPPPGRKKRRESRTELDKPLPYRVPSSFLFESHVRDYLAARIKPEAAGLSDPILKEAAEDAIQGVEEGSFSRRVLSPLKEQGHVSGALVTQVDQVRDYRNWVAHGRRDAPTNNITPLMAYERLKEFLAVLSIAAESEEAAPEPLGEGAE